jgi:hypothetical protein
MWLHICDMPFTSVAMLSSSGRTSMLKHPAAVVCAVFLYSCTWAYVRRIVSCSLYSCTTGYTGGHVGHAAVGSIGTPWVSHVTLVMSPSRLGKLCVLGIVSLCNTTHSMFNMSMSIECWQNDKINFPLSRKAVGKVLLSFCTCNDY